MNRKADSEQHFHSYEVTQFVRIMSKDDSFLRHIVFVYAVAEKWVKKRIYKLKQRTTLSQ